MRLLIIGAGGHAKVVASAAVEAGWEIAGIEDISGKRTELMGMPVVTDATDIDADAFVVAIGFNRVRAERFEHYVSTGMVAAIIIHPRATVDASARIGAGTVVFAGAVVNAAASVGENVILNTGCTVDHDCWVGDHAHVGPGVNLCGKVAVGPGALMGAGSCAIPHTRVGSWATVGAGSVVTVHIRDGVTAVGSPARELE